MALQTTSKGVVDVSGSVEPGASQEAFDMERLERVVSKLVQEHEQLRGAHDLIRKELAARDARIRNLEEQIRVANQQKRDVAKRIDELIGQMDHLDAQLAEAGS